VLTMASKAALVVLLALTLLGCSNEERVTVPDLRAASVVEAYAQLRELGLKVEIDGSIYAGSTGSSGIGGQTPEAGKSVEVGSVVTLRPGFRPIGSVFGVDQPDPVVLPDLIGVRLDIAVRRLENLGLLWWTRSMPALPASDGPTLLAQYEVARMAAPPGSSYDQYSRKGNASHFKPLGLWTKLADD
jgi:PASTA domain